MEDKHHTGETRYFDPSGKELTEEEYKKLMKKSGARPQEKEVSANDKGPNTTGGKD